MVCRGHGEKSRGGRAGDEEVLALEQWGEGERDTVGGGVGGLSYFHRNFLI